MRLPRIERVVRAICSDKIDAQNGRIATSLFKGHEISLSRLIITPLAQQWFVLAATVQKLPGRRLVKLGELGVGDIEDTGTQYRQNETPAPPPVTLTVVERPTEHNRAHAVIAEDIKADGLANSIKARLIFHDPPAGFNAESVARII